MTEQLPSTGARGCDTSEMKTIHRMFRALFRDARTLVADAADGDAERAGVVSGFVLEITEGLHHHHLSEDELLWDELEARAPACAAHVELMRAQHKAIADELAVLESAVPRWQAGTDAASKAAVLAGVDSTVIALEQHLGDEEEIILPAASQSFTQAEWDRLGEAARAKIPRDRMFIQLGYVMSTMDETERKQWARKNLPLPARALYAMIGRRQYEREHTRIYGTPVG